jgi:DNA repair protein SbcD/Mre11
MRILHTADWHLCDKLGRIDRTADLRSRVEAVASLCEQHSVDVLLIAGDLFSEQASVDQMTASLQHINETFAGFFAGGGTVVAVTGNHDHDGRVEMIRQGMRLATPQAAGLTRGRMYLLNGCLLTSLEGPSGGRVQFALMPFPKLGRYGHFEDRYHTKEEENRLLQQRAVFLLGEMMQNDPFDATLPTVLVGHLHVRGAEVHSLYKMSERDDIILDAGSLPTHLAYIALGHIHKAQTIGGMRHVRYCGSLDRLDFGERDNDCGVILLEVGPTGLSAEPAWLRIDPTPFHDIVIDDPDAQMPGLAALYADRDRAVVRLTVHHRGAGRSRDEIGRELRELFPRFKELNWADPESPAVGGNGGAFVPKATLAATVRHYLERELTDDPDREAVLALADSFIARGGDR